MRIPHVRFTVRRMMLSLAAIALILGTSIQTVRLKRQRDYCLLWAEIHAQSERSNFEIAQSSNEMAERTESAIATLESFALDPRKERSKFEVEWVTTIVERKKREASKLRDRTTELRDRATRYSKVAAFHADLKRMYLRAAARPWRHVEAEPGIRAYNWSNSGDYGRALAAYEEAILGDP
jgi:hypothetical protein